jgi:AcrR family transcriptional regulator
MTVPTAVYVIWIVVLAVAVLIILPLTIYLLQRTLNAARNIERYLAEMRDAGVGIANNTDHITALDETIAVATQAVGDGRSNQRAHGDDGDDTRCAGARRWADVALAPMGCTSPAAVVGLSVTPDERLPLLDTERSTGWARYCSTSPSRSC